MRAAINVLPSGDGALAGRDGESQLQDLVSNPRNDSWPTIETYKAHNCGEHATVLWQVSSIVLIYIACKTCRCRVVDSVSLACVEFHASHLIQTKTASTGRRKMKQRNKGCRYFGHGRDDQ